MRVVHRMTEHDGRGARRLEAQHLRRVGRLAQPQVLGIALPVGGDVARVAHRQHVVLRRVAQHVNDLKRGGLLPLDAVRVDGVHQRDGVRLGDLAHETQRVIEIAVNRQHLRAVNHRLREFAQCDIPVRDEHDAAHAGARGVGGGGGGGVAGAGAHHRLRAGLARLADRHRHAAVLERPRRIQPLELRVDALGQPQLRPQVVQRNQRGVPFQQRHHRRGVGHGKVLPILANQAGPAGGGQRHGHRYTLSGDARIIADSPTRRKARGGGQLTHGHISPARRHSTV
ncbi:MAG: hypothetical protein BWY76_01527 [bacterium ADurb.Bin429]|nr:MAG: hypothetical protein BWY76_01527 [bacterium ADurb.Bin429]